MRYEVELFTFGMLTTAHKASSLYKQEKGALHKKAQGLQPIVSNSMDMVPKRLVGTVRVYIYDIVS